MTDASWSDFVGSDGLVADAANAAETLYNEVNADPAASLDEFSSALGATSAMDDAQMRVEVADDAIQNAEFWQANAADYQEDAAQFLADGNIDAAEDALQSAGFAAQNAETYADTATTAQHDAAWELNDAAESLGVGDQTDSTFSTESFASGLESVQDQAEAFTAASDTGFADSGWDVADAGSGWDATSAIDTTSTFDATSSFDSTSTFDASSSFDATSSFDSGEI